MWSPLTTTQPRDTTDYTFVSGEYADRDFRIHDDGTPRLISLFKIPIPIQTIWPYSSPL